MRKKIELDKRWYQKIPWTRVLLGTVIGSLIGVAFSLSLNNDDSIKKNVVNQYVCKIVGAEPEQNIIAVECLTK